MASSLHFELETFRNVVFETMLPRRSVVFVTSIIHKIMPQQNIFLFIKPPILSTQTLWIQNFSLATGPFKETLTFNQSFGQAQKAQL